VAYFDLDLAELDTYRPVVAEPDDFDEFWAGTLDQSRALRRAPILTSSQSGIEVFEVSDFRFSGFAGDEVSAWMVTPSTPRGTIIEFNGYGGGRGFPHERLWWPAAGYRWVFMDTRGQGSAWGSGGVTPDPHGSDPHVAGFMTQGILSPDTYYFRRVFTDAVMLVETLVEEGINDSPLVVAGGSQGGGIALAVAGLSHVDGVLCDVPFLCHFERAVTITDDYPYREVADYLAVHRGAHDSVFRTLSYVDGVNFAKRAGAPALFSTALMDSVCPPSTVFAAKNLYQGQSEMVVYPFNGHEGGGGHHFLNQLDWLKRFD
jgi:cephalosporin-C deacetylase